MKHLKPLLAVAIVALAMALPSIAAAQYHEERLDHFLDDHPHMRADLSRNPDLIFDRQYRHAHPDLQVFMQQHPNVWGKLAGNGRWGAYGPDHDWHEADWWHEHDPDWLYHNHPEWAESHADWREDREHHPEWFKHEEHEEHEEAKHEHHEAVEAREHEHEHGHHGDHDHDKH